jgi:hypothetical protein
MGQSNIPTGATIGSNHNSRAADGEILAGRGFWPGLCVSLKHNSKFACFTMIAKGDYLFELDIPMPFSLVSLDYSKDALTIMPAYWFMYNMYALERNAWKYADRDQRDEKIQWLENDYLAPDSINEMFDALKLLEKFTGKAWMKWQGKDADDAACIQQGKSLLENQEAIVHELEIVAEGFEHAKRKTIINKTQLAYNAYKEMIAWYGLNNLISHIEISQHHAGEKIIALFSGLSGRNEWANIGGQLMPVATVEDLKTDIRNKTIDSWDHLHAAYSETGNAYPQQKLQHALNALLEIENIKSEQVSLDRIIAWMDIAIALKTSIVSRITESRKKDYTNPFRKMMYGSDEEMDKVLGAFESNSFVQQQQQSLQDFCKKVETIKSKL